MNVSFHKQTEQSLQAQYTQTIVYRMFAQITWRQFAQYGLARLLRVNVQDRF